MRKKGLLRVIGGSAILTILVLLLLGVCISQGWATEPIKIGAILEFTGPMADYGPLLKEGIEMRLEEAGYKVAGRPIKLIIEDGATNTSISLEKAKKLVEKDKVEIILGPNHSGVATGLAPYFSKNKVISLGLMDHPVELAKSGHVLVYPASLYTVGMPLGWYAYDNLGYRSVTSIGADYVAGYQFIGGILDMFEKEGGLWLENSGPR